MPGDGREQGHHRRRTIRGGSEKVPCGPGLLSARLRQTALVALADPPASRYRLADPHLHRARLTIGPEIIGNGRELVGFEARRRGSVERRLCVAGFQAPAFRDQRHRAPEQVGAPFRPEVGRRAAASGFGPERPGCRPPPRNRSAGRASAPRVRRPCARAGARRGARAASADAG